MIEDDDLLEKCNTIWDKVRANIKKELDSVPVCNIYIYIFLKTNIKLHGNDVTDFYDKKIFNHTCLAVINWDSALKKVIILKGF